MQFSHNKTTGFGIFTTTTNKQFTNIRRFMKNICMKLNYIEKNLAWRATFTMPKASILEHNFMTFTLHQSCKTVKSYVVAYVQTSWRTSLHLEWINEWKHHREGYANSNIVSISTTLCLFLFGTTNEGEEIRKTWRPLGKLTIVKPKPRCG